MYPKPADPRWLPRNRRNWSYLGVGLGLGSDGLRGMMAGRYKFMMNMSQNPDPSHGGGRDEDLVLKRCKLKSWWISMMVSWKLKHRLARALAFSSPGPTATRCTEG